MTPANLKTTSNQVHLHLVLKMVLICSPKIQMMMGIPMKESLYHEAIGSKASSNAPRRHILKPDSTILTGESDTETDSLPSLLNQDDAITISDDLDLEAKILSFCTEHQV